MTERELKRLLWDYPNLKQKKEAVKKEKEALVDWANVVREISSPVIDGMPHGTTVSNPTYAKTQKYLDEYALEIDKLGTICSEIAEQEIVVRDLLKRLSEKEYRIIELFYFECRQWFYIARVIHWSERQCRRIRDASISKMIE